MIRALQIALYVAIILFAIYFLYDLVKAKRENRLEKENIVKPLFIGFFTDFFDTLGIGSFAPTIFLLKVLKCNVRDKQIPATINVAHTIPVLIEAILFIRATEVEAITLVSLIVSSVIGSYVGAGIVSKMKENTIRLVMGIALLCSAILFTLSLLKIMPIGGEALGLSGLKLIIAIIIFFILGALMTAGIGLYAPAMVVVYSMGMNPLAAFPIMMGSCALLMPVAGYRFIKENAYSRLPAIMITISGVIGIVIAYNFVKNMPLEHLKVLVVIVVTFTAVSMLRTVFKRSCEVGITLN